MTNEMAQIRNAFIAMDSLVQTAVDKYGEIEPCMRNIEDQPTTCFTNEGDSLFFWFNDRSGSTHLVSHRKGN